jgi:hypothetical protein
LATLAASEAAGGPRCTLLTQAATDDDQIHSNFDDISISRFPDIFGLDCCHSCFAPVLYRGGHFGEMPTNLRQNVRKRPFSGGGCRFWCVAIGSLCDALLAASASLSILFLDPLVPLSLSLLLLSPLSRCLLAYFSQSVSQRPPALTHSQKRKRRRRLATYSLSLKGRGGDHPPPRM